MDRPSQRPGEPTPESIYVEWLARRRDGEEVELEEVCLAHPEAAEAIRDLHRRFAELEALERNFGLMGSVSEQLASRYGSEVDPHVELEGEDAGDFTSKLLGRLSDRAPSSRRYRLKGEVATGGMGAILRVGDEDMRRPAPAPSAPGGLRLRLLGSAEAPKRASASPKDGTSDQESSLPGAKPARQGGKESSKCKCTPPAATQPSTTQALRAAIE